MIPRAHPLSVPSRSRVPTVGSLALLAFAALACGGGATPTGTDDGPGEPVVSENGQITATVTDGTEPVADAVVELTGSGGTVLDRVTTPGDGRVVFEELAPADYEVEVQPVDAYVQGPNGASLRAVTVESGGSPAVTLPLFLTVTDIDGNTYRTVELGQQRWTAENLRTARYRNGDPVARAETTEEWKTARESGTGAWAFFENDPANEEAYGRLYNHHAAADARGLCPEGWHVPTEAEWQALESHLGMGSELGETGFRGGADALGGRLKSRKTEPSPFTGWVSPNAGATNETGFTAVGNGYRVGKPILARQVEGSFHESGEEGGFWSSSPRDDGEGEPGDYWGRGLRTDERGIYRSGANGFGFGVRCLEDGS